MTSAQKTIHKLKTNKNGNVITDGENLKSLSFMVESDNNFIRILKNTSKKNVMLFCQKMWLYGVTALARIVVKILY